MGKYEITYYMWPDPNISIVIEAKNEEEAMIFAKQHRDGSFSVKEIKEEDKA